MKIALRESRAAKRSYVLVNPLLAKHMPAKPEESLAYFSQLGEKVAAAAAGCRVLVIGFAETATAVGAVVAGAIKNAVYVHTTREALPGEQLVAAFLEEHSHAAEQTLYLRDGFRDLSRYDCLVFVEDEITTGKTILNFLKLIHWKGKLILSALVFNGFNANVFAEYNVTCICLEQTKAEAVQYLTFENFPNPRLGVNMDAYNTCCQNLAAYILASADEKHVKGRNILVLGTEEFMYPALFFGRTLAGTAKSVQSHSTTRSPLLPQANAAYPLKTRNTFSSVYDQERTTHLYNLAKYDTVFLMTDAAAPNLPELIHVIQSYENHVIYAVRIRHEA